MQFRQAYAVVHILYQQDASGYTQSSFLSLSVITYVIGLAQFFWQNTRKEMDLCYIPADGNTWKTGLIAYRLPELP